MYNRERHPQVTARLLDHYKKVFPDLFNSEYQGKGLILGAGLGSTALHSNFTALDVGYTDPEQMLVQLYANSDNAPMWGQEDEVIAYLMAAKLGFLENNKLVAALISDRHGLPFALHAFDDIVSNNCLFGGMETRLGISRTLKVIKNIMAHLKPDGALHLFPCFTTHPGEIGLSIQNSWSHSYVETYLAQEAILRQLAKDGLRIDLQVTSKVENRLPNILETVSIKAA
jgi:hypothetical protein